MAICIVSGPVNDTAGEILPGTVITFERQCVVGQDVKAVLPRPGAGHGVG